MRVLVTTALEQSWPEDEPVVFLGEWCRRFVRRERWQALDAEVMPYHWDDRERFHEDYDRLLLVYEELLVELGQALNEVHGVDRSIRFWRILVGPWLGFFIQMAWDRWRMLELAAIRGDVVGTIVLDGVDRGLVPSDMVDFKRLYVTDEWNHHLCHRILEAQGRIPIRRQGFVVGGADGSPPERVPVPSSVKVELLRIWSRVASRLARRGDVAVVSPYMTWSSEMDLHRRLGQLPFVWSLVEQPTERFDGATRSWSLGGSSEDDFGSFVRAVVPHQIPAAYVEGFGRLAGMADEAGWPPEAPVVFTCNSHYADDVFKAWTAARVEQGAHLVIGQHGGNFGISRRVFTEDHEVAIADRYLSWGWSDPSRPDIRPVGQLMVQPALTSASGADQRLLLVTTTVPRQSYHLFSGMVSSQWLSYLEDQFSFAEALPGDLRERLLVRLYSHDYGWDQEERWRDRLPEVELEPGAAPMRSLMERCHLYVATYNATTFLETFAMDVPTVMFWNPGHWEVRDSASEAFEGLREAGVLHDTPESAARHVGEVWSDVPEWWLGDRVRSARREFDAALNWHGGDVVGAVARELVAAVGEAGPRRLRRRALRWSGSEQRGDH